MANQADTTSRAAAARRSPWVLVRSVGHHPFVYRKMVREIDPAAQPGDVVHVYDRDDAYFGEALFNPRSQIVLRLLTREDRAIDAAFWKERIEQAVALRRALRLDDMTDAYRLVHAEGDNLTGLVVERFADALVIEPFSLGMYYRWEELAALLGEILGPPTSLDRPDRTCPTWRLFVRADSRIERLEGFHVPPTKSSATTKTVIREHDVRYRIDPAAGHKTGFFCDQRDNRRRLALFCKGADVLDVCCYVGAFSLCARKLGQARSVTGVDLDENAIAMAKDNANLNQERIDFVYADAFTYMRQMLANKRQYDVVVLDPPKLALSRSELEDALRRYHDFNHLAVQMVRPGGVLLTCSCSGLVSDGRFSEAVRIAARRAGRTLQVFDKAGAAPDHPVMMDCPESAYLKTLWCRVF